MARDLHRIRLRGPWQLEALARFQAQSGDLDLTTAELPAPARMQMPADWSASFGDAFFGRVRYRRAFHKPTGLDLGERVFLVIEPPRSEGEAALNGVVLGRVAGDTARFDITDRLDYDNLLEIVVTHPAGRESKVTAGELAGLAPGGLVGEVRLEIEE